MLCHGRSIAAGCSGLKRIHGVGLIVNRHSTVTHYQRPTVTQLQEGGTGGEVSEILFFSAKSKRRPSLIYSMQIIPVCLSIVARRKGVSATRRRGLNWTPISLLVGHPCKLFHTPEITYIATDAMIVGRYDNFLHVSCTYPYPKRRAGNRSKARAKPWSLAIATRNNLSPARSGRDRRIRLTAAKHLGICRPTAYKVINEASQRQVFAESSTLE